MFHLLPSLSAAATLCTIVSSLAVVLHGYMRYQRRKYPPGPLGDPLIGNYRHMPAEHPWLYYTELKKKYGDLVFTQVMSQKILLLGSYDVANRLLAKRGAIFSERFQYPLIQETYVLQS